MNTTIDIELAGMLFHVESAAHELLQTYLDSIERVVRSTEGGDEILREVEARLAELLQQSLGDGRQVVKLADVESACEQLGSPRDFAEDEDESADSDDQKRASSGTSGPSDGSAESRKSSRRLYRDTENGFLGGVATGMAHYFDADPVLIRAIAIIAVLFTGVGLPLYVLFWVITPKAQTVAERLAMRGERPTFENIKTRVQSEYSRMERHVNAAGMGDRLRLFVREFFGVLGKILRGGLRLFGWLVLIAVFVLFVSGAFSLFAVLIGWGDLVVDGVNLAPVPETVDRGLELVLPHRFTPAVLWSLAGALLVFPLVLFGWLVMRLMFQTIPNPKGTRVALVLGALISLCGVIGLGVLGGRTAMEFRERAQVRETLAVVADSSHVTVRLAPHSWEGNPADMGIWTFTEHGVESPFVELEILPTVRNSPEVRIEREARGIHQPAAYQRASRIAYEPRIQNGIIELPAVLNFPTEDQFRGQHVEVQVLIPEGFTVDLDPNLNQFWDDIEVMTAEDESTDGSLQTAGELTLQWKMTANGAVSHSESQSANDSEKDER